MILLARYRKRRTWWSRDVHGGLVIDLSCQARRADRGVMGRSWRDQAIVLCIVVLYSYVRSVARPRHKIKDIVRMAAFMKYSHLLYLKCDLSPLIFDMMWCNNIVSEGIKGF